MWSCYMAFLHYVLDNYAAISAEAEHSSFSRSSFSNFVIIIGKDFIPSHVALLSLLQCIFIHSYEGTSPSFIKNISFAKQQGYRHLLFCGQLCPLAYGMWRMKFIMTTSGGSFSITSSTSLRSPNGYPLVFPSFHHD